MVQWAGAGKGGKYYTKGAVAVGAGRMELELMLCWDAPWARRLSSDDR